MSLTTHVPVPVLCPFVLLTLTIKMKGNRLNHMTISQLLPLIQPLSLSLCPCDSDFQDKG